eukprot:Awhi_evm1s12097
MWDWAIGGLTKDSLPVLELVHWAYEVSFAKTLFLCLRYEVPFEDLQFKKAIDVFQETFIDIDIT